jgi:hypothetical protein
MAAEKQKKTNLRHVFPAGLEFAASGRANIASSALNFHAKD